MKRLKWTLVTVAMLSLVSITACGDNQSDATPIATPVAGSTPTHGVAPLKSSKPVTDEDIKVVYRKNCLACHGEDGAGRKDNAPTVPDFTDANWQKQHTDEEFIKSVVDGKGRGKGAMPRWNTKLTEEEIVGVCKYVRTFAK